MIRCNSHKILLIDDELGILHMLKLKLTSIGFSVDTAGSGEEGLARIKSNKYSLILTDIQMPGISGDKILSFVKNEAKSAVPVVGMSGTPWLLNENDFDATLQKPFTLKELEDTLCSLINEE